MDLKTISEMKNNTDSITELANICRGDILKMTTLAGSGHPGGSMSSLDMLLAVYKCANISKNNIRDNSRDRIIVSHGHISPAVYSVLGRLDFFDIKEAVSQFRLAGSIFEGHIERTVPGVEWSTGNLGQGLSAACGAAVAGKAQNNSFDIFVFMGDGEHQKGQISEARRFAVKYNLSNITLFLDYNKLQISGDISKVMPQNIKDEYIADGWVVLEIDGHNFKEIFSALEKAKNIDRPTLIMSKTIMGKNVSFMENIHDYHGKTLTEEQLTNALKELKLQNDIEEYKLLRKSFNSSKSLHSIQHDSIKINTGLPRNYDLKTSLDNRSAFGNALTDIVQLNYSEDKTPIVVFDCDLASSVKTDKIMKDFPNAFIQSGIQEHHTATMAGTASVNGVISFFADFGVFGVDEVYNQQRLNDINGCNVKIVTTHVGIDVGEDGKTHQCIDYVGVLRNSFGFKIIVPADPNQTDKAVRYATANYGNFLIAMGRSKTPVISDEQGAPFYGENYSFEYGKMDTIRKGNIPLITYGAMAPHALNVKELLKDKADISVICASSPAEINIDDLKEATKNSEHIFVYEDHNKYTGLGSTIALQLAENGVSKKLTIFGVEGYAYSGKPEDVLKLIKLDPKSVADKIYNILN